MTKMSELDRTPHVGNKWNREEDDIQAAQREWE